MEYLKRVSKRVDDLTDEEFKQLLIECGIELYEVPLQLTPRKSIDKDIFPKNVDMFEHEKECAKNR